MTTDRLVDLVVFVVLFAVIWLVVWRTQRPRPLPGGTAADRDLIRQTAAFQAVANYARSVHGMADGGRCGCGAPLECIERRRLDEYAERILEAGG